MNNIMMNVCNGEHIGISPLTKKQVKPKNSSVANNLGTIQLLRLHKLGGFLTPPPPLFALARFLDTPPPPPSRSERSIFRFSANPPPFTSHTSFE